MAQPTPEIRALRRRLRAARSALPERERLAAEQAIAETVTRLRLLRRGRRVALYLSMPGEVSPSALVEQAWRAGCRLYVPRVSSRRRGTMDFVPLEPGARFRRNAYGIAEPVLDATRRVRALVLDAVLLPVVGFDRSGHRLGMGAGYYDRALRHLRDPARRWRRPRLVGLAFACQEVVRIEPSRWDVPLDLVVTERDTIVTADARRPRRSEP